MRILIHRSGAFGDVVVLTPIIRHLHSKGHELIVIVNERGEQILRRNPHISKLIIQKQDEIKIELLGEHLEWMRKKHHCDRLIDFSESIECSLSQHPRSPNYKLSKEERLKRFNRNFYEFSFEWAKEEWKGVDLKPELFFDVEELNQASNYLREGSFNILVGMSGSGTNKTWPHTEALCEEILKFIPNAHIITVGDAKAKIIEPHMEGITNLSGECTMRVSMALTSMVNLVISPDTGLLHASGCYENPKIGLLGHNTIECITKYFTNDFSIESNSDLAECSPCLYLIYSKRIQCVCDEFFGGASICMSRGLPIHEVFEKVRKVYEIFKPKTS